MAGMFSVPSPPALLPPPRMPVPGDQADMAARRKAQLDLANMQGRESTDLTGEGRSSDSGSFTGTVLGK